MCAASTTSSSDDFIGTVIADRYQVVRLVGKGGMGTVYEALHLQLGRRVAVKRLASHLQGDSEAFARFRREAEVVAGFQHPNIVSVLAFETLEDGSPCIVMEYLSGEDLGTRIRNKGPLAWPELARVFDEVASALVVAHKAGIVHRDLKPQNIFLAVDDEGREAAKLLDFGLSKIHDAPSGLTSETRAVGTPAYMSPEQADGRHDDVGAATDIWAMGCVLFEMASGQLAFDADSVPSLLYRICHGTPNDLLGHRKEAPEGFVRAIERCLEHDPAERIPSAEVLRVEVRRALQRLAPGAFRDIGVRGETVAAPRSAVPAVGTMTTLAASCGALEPVGLEPTLASHEPVGKKAVVPTASVEARPRLRKRMLVAPALMLAALSMAAGIFVATRTGHRQDTDDPHAGARVARAAATPTLIPPVRSSADAGIVSVDASPRTVSIVLRSDPSGANVFDASNRYVGITPLTLSQATSRGRERFTLRKAGYGDATAEVSLTDDSTTEVSLAKERRRQLERAREVEPPRTEELVQEAPPKRLRGAYEEEL